MSMDLAKIVNYKQFKKNYKVLFIYYFIYILLFILLIFYLILAKKLSYSHIIHSFTKIVYSTKYS